MKKGSDAAELPIVKRGLFSWVLSGQWHLQAALVGVIVCTVFARVLPLEMQKRIINEAISLRQFDRLLIYSAVYLVAVASASGLKFAINYLQVRIGQRAMTDMRKELYHHILTLPMGFFRKTQPGMVVSSIVTELNTAGSFAGMALAVPLTSVFTLIAFSVYLFWLHAVLATVTLAIYPIVVFVIPKLQKGANRANKKRVDVSRVLSSRIAETISGIHEVQGHGAFAVENRAFDDIVERLLKIRIVWSLWRFGVKVANNFFVSLGPFTVFLLGGYFVMRGSLELGAMVAFLSAQEKLYDPWKELIEFYQVYQDASVRYNRVMEYFDVEPEFALPAPGSAPPPVGGEVEVKNLSFVTDDGITLLNNISLSLAAGEHLALVGFSGSGKSTLALCISQLYRPTAGQVLIGGRDAAEMGKDELVRTVGIVAQEPFIFTGTIRDNLLYAWSAAAGRAALTPDADGRPDLDSMIEALQQAGLFVDVLRFGMNAVLPADQEADQAAILRIRRTFQEEFGVMLRRDIEFFQHDRFLNYSSLAENIIFGAPLKTALDHGRLARRPEFRQFLADHDLLSTLVALGEDLVRRSVELLEGVEPDDVFFRQSPIAAQELTAFQELLRTLPATGPYPDAARDQFLTVALRYTPGHHKMLSAPAGLAEAILAVRPRFRKWCREAFPGYVAFYDEETFIPSQTILTNIVFGHMKSDGGQARDRVTQALIQLLIEEDLLESIARIGMDFHVGSKGDKLSGGQRQKLAIARVFLKQPRIMIMDEATSALDNNSQTRITNLLSRRYKGRTTVIAVVHRLDSIGAFDRVAVMKAGKLEEIGPYETLIQQKGVLYELVHGQQQ